MANVFLMHLTLSNVNECTPETGGEGENEQSLGFVDLNLLGEKYTGAADTSRTSIISDLSK